MAKPKLVISIEASEWTEEGIESYIEHLRSELTTANMGTGDDAEIVGWRLVEESDDLSSSMKQCADEICQSLAKPSFLERIKRLINSFKQ